MTFVSIAAGPHGLSPIWIRSVPLNEPYGIGELQRVDPRLRARSAMGAIGCASAGLGIAVASTWTCGDELDSGALVEVLADYQLDPATAFIVFSAGRPPSQKARALSGHLEKALAVSDRP